MTLLIFVFAPALAALSLMLVPRAWLARIVIAVPLAIFSGLVASEPLAVEIPWIPSLGVALAFRMDGLGLLFALIISGMGTLVLLYASSYFDDAADYVRFSAYTLVFMTAMLGIVLSSNLLLIFVFWELTSLTSYLLIGFYHEKSAARDGARQALLITGTGGLAMLAGFILMDLVGGTFDLNVLLNSGNLLRESTLYIPILLLILLGAFSKSAQWPLHFWLPGAMEAPAPASTYLHSATMVKAGIFLLARLSPVLNNTDPWLYLLTGVGLITFIYGAVVALRQTDLKAILAYSTVSWLGILVAVQGPTSQYGAIALALGILGHALYKGALFLMAGAVDHGVGTRDINQLGGLMRKMPLTFAGTLIAAISMAGIPPLLGFLAKETLLAASLYEGQPEIIRTLMTVVVVIGSALTVTVALRLLIDTFITPARSEAVDHAHEASWPMWLGPVILGVFSLILPFILPATLDPLMSRFVNTLQGTEATIHLHLFEGINTPLILSTIAIGVGLALFMLRHRWLAGLQHLPEYNPAAVYRWVFYQALPAGAEWVTSHLQTGRMRFYLLIVFTLLIVLTLGTMLLAQIQLVGDDVLAGFDWQIALVCVLLMIGAVAGILAPTRLSAIAILGIEGALLSLLFALFGAPDLAFTQLMIEVITLVLFVLAFHFLPDVFLSRFSRRSQILDILVAASAGLVITVLILAARSNPIGESISPWHVENSVAIGQGHNVVNVILVDFRGMDTQGEIVVLVIAAMGVAALLRLRPPGQPRGQYITTSDAQVDDETNEVT